MGANATICYDSWRLTEDDGHLQSSFIILLQTFTNLESWKRLLMRSRFLILLP